MTPILQRIYQSEGGSEVCDTLMKYLYKGMGQGQSESGLAAAKNMTPQQTGFTQVGGRSFGGAEGGGQAMSVLLSWHEKVSLVAALLWSCASLTKVSACGAGWPRKHCQGYV